MCIGCVCVAWLLFCLFCAPHKATRGGVRCCKGGGSMALCCAKKLAHTLYHAQQHNEYEPVLVVFATCGVHRAPRYSL